MNFDNVVTEVKGRLEVVGNRAQGAAEASFKTIKQANGVVLTGVQGLVKTHTEAGKALIEAGMTSFEKAKTDGLMAVASNPIEYIPAGKTALTGAFDETVKIATKTGEQLVKVIRTGYVTVAKKVAGKPVTKRAKSAGKRRTARKVHARHATNGATA